MFLNSIRSGSFVPGPPWIHELAGVVVASVEGLTDATSNFVTDDWPNAETQAAKAISFIPLFREPAHIIMTR